MRKLDRLTTLLAHLAVRNPRIAFRLASVLGAARHAVTGRWPSSHEVGSVRARLKMAALEERNEVLVRCIRRAGLDPIRPLVAPPPDLQGPVILGTFHVGALHAVGAALEALGKPVLAIRYGRLFEPRPPLELMTAQGSDEQRAAAFLRALQYLRAGNLVVLALDAAPGAAIETVCLGHRLFLARGPFALARMSGAPIVPLVMRWNGTDLQLILGERLTGDGEEALARAAAGWLDRYLRQSPQELTLGLLRELLYAEPRSTS